jgi:general secretion pathway protein H
MSTHWAPMGSRVARAPMRTLATGRSRSRPSGAAPSPIGGFTLVEILVVVVIVGILSVGVVISLGVIGGDRELERERDRIVAVTDYLREQAALQNREFGMRVFSGGYEFLAWDPRTGLWERVQGDPLLRTRDLPEGLETRLLVEGRPVILPLADAKGIAPQIMLFSSGELNSFELTLRRSTSGESTASDSGPAEIFSPDMQTGRIVVRSLPDGPS